MLKKKQKVLIVAKIMSDCKPHCVNCIEKETGFKTYSGAHLFKDMGDFGYDFENLSNPNSSNKAWKSFCKKCNSKHSHRKLTNSLPIHEQKGNLNRTTFSPEDKKRVWKIFDKKCPVSNTTIAHYGDIEIDHRSPAKELTEKETPLDQLTDQEIKDKYLPLNKQDNFKKRNKCKTCLETKKRPSGWAGIKWFFEGGEDYTEETKCNGCPWAYPEKYGKAVQKILDNIG